MKYHSYFSILFQPIRTIPAINEAVATNSSWSTRSKSNHCYTILRASAFEFCFQANENVLLMRFNSCPFSYAVAWNSFPVSSFIWRKEELNEAKACPSPLFFLPSPCWQTERRNPLCNCSSHRRIFHIVADSWFRSVYLCAWESSEMTLTAFS